jgi:ATP/maltotriose-dependent transcriptional regulator MalT
VAVLDALLRYAPSQLPVVVASRLELALDVPALQLDGRAGVINERHPALTDSETAEALRLLGADLTPEVAVAATGGWMAGVMFEAWRAGDPRAGGGGLADPLHGYLGRNILDQLNAAERGIPQAVNARLRLQAPSRAWKDLGLAWLGDDT